ncbi:MAG: hypothetical protein IJI22_00040 [Bacilli bacterium]|nr:hypothetical protein [Bacilli bacterium]
MELVEMAVKTKKINDSVEFIIKYYNTAISNLLKASTILAKTNHPSLSETKKQIEELKTKVNNISNEYMESLRIINTYIKKSNENCDNLSDDLSIISKDLMDIVSSIE